MEEVLFQASPLQQRTDAVNEKIVTKIHEIKRQKRRSNEEMLADSIVDLYARIEAKVKSMRDTQKELEELFDALRPLRELEEQYRGKNGIE